MPASGGDRRFVHLFGGSRENSDLVGIAKAACKEGFAVLPVYPGEKRPLCTLTDRARNAADRLAANTARAEGKRRWELAKHPCGRVHAITDPAEAERVFKRLVLKYPDLNIGLEVGASRLLVVDADTVAEVTSFTTYWAEREGVPELVNAAPTVHSPGVLKDPDDETSWTHKHGGHFWFLLPEEVNFSEVAYATAMKIGAHATKATLMFHDQLVLVPPSVRPEGAYTMGSDIQPAPEWMIEELLAHIAGNARVTEEHRRSVLDGDDDIEAHFADRPWEEILLPYGWNTSGRPDSCGCEIWTRPGDWSSPKSATAHDLGCLAFEDRCFLHLWTDNPPEELAGKKTWSKLQVIAAYEYGGDAGTAMRELGITRANPAGEPTVLTRKDVTTPEHDANDNAPAAVDADDEDEEDDPAPEERTSWFFRDLDPILAGENPEPEPTILRREDGQALFYAGKVNGIIGPSESGKSWLALLAVAQELEAGHAVLYMDFEDTASGIVGRLQSLGVPNDRMHSSARLLGYVGPEEGLHAISKSDLVEVLQDRTWSMIVLDGVNAAMTQLGLDLMSNTDATKFFVQLTRPMSMTGAAVVTIDHVPKDADNRHKGGIGAQAKRATVTGCAISVDVVAAFGRGRDGELRLSVDKDRPGYVRGSSNIADVWADASIEAHASGEVRIHMKAPKAITKIGGPTDEKADEYRIKVVKWLESVESEQSGNAIEKGIPGTATHKRDAIAWLAENEYIHRRPDPKSNRTILYSYRRDYTGAGPTTLAHQDPSGGSNA
jgi:hypothetical protein